MLVLTEKPKKRAFKSASGHRKLESGRDDVASAEEVRADKVLDIKRQLAEGCYDVNRGLDASIDRILEDLLE